MTKPISVFVNIYHPAHLGGAVYTITQQAMYHTQEEALVRNSRRVSGELLHAGLEISFIPEMDEHPYEVPDGHIVRFMNVIRPYKEGSHYVAGQAGLYPTAEAAKEQADRHRKGYYMEEHYIAAAVPVIFKGLPMEDGWVKHECFNYEAVHREERAVVD